MKFRITGIAMKSLLGTIRKGMQAEIEEITEHNRRVDVNNQWLEARSEEAQNRVENAMVNQYKEALADEFVRGFFFQQKPKYSKSEIYKMGEIYRKSSAVRAQKAKENVSFMDQLIERKSYPDSRFIRRLECAVEISSEILISDADFDSLVKYTGGYVKFMDIFGVAADLSE